MPKSYRNHSKTFNTPRHSFVKDRIDQEIKLCGEYGLKNKKEIWRVQLILAQMRKRARQLLTLEETSPIRIFEGQALMNRLFKFGLLNKETENGLDYVLGLNIQRLLDRRLQTLVFRNKVSKSIHEARVRINSKQIVVNNKLVDVASYMVSVENENKIGLRNNTPLTSDRKGRISKKRKNQN